MITVGDYDRELSDAPTAFYTHHEGFLRAVRGEMDTLSPFKVAPLSQLFTLACIAQRIDRGFAFDKATGSILGATEANAFLRNHRARDGKGFTKCEKGERTRADTDKKISSTLCKPPMRKHPSLPNQRDGRFLPAEWFSDILMSATKHIP